MAAALIAAVNDYIAKEWLDREPRLRASILLPLHNPELAVKEIERLAHDKRFVQVLMPVMGEMPLGRRIYWPIYEAAETPRPHRRCARGLDLSHVADRRRLAVLSGRGLHRAER